MRHSWRSGGFGNIARAQGILNLDHEWVESCDETERVSHAVFTASKAEKRGEAMSAWNMLALVGEDKPGIVAQVTDVLYRHGWNLGEASMMRLGGNFSIMMMVYGTGGKEVLRPLIEPVAQHLGLRFHVFPIHGGLHRHLVPNIQVRVNGADRAGIVAKVTGALAKKGFNILELDSDVAGTPERPIYIMSIQGFAEATVEELQVAVNAAKDADIQVDVSPIETFIG